MKRLMKMISITLVFLLAFGTASCGKSGGPAGGSTDTPTGGQPEQSGSTTEKPETVTLDVGLQTASVEKLLPENNEVSKWLEDQTGVHLNIIQIPVESPLEKVNLLINSGDYPEMFVHTSYTYISNNDVYKYGVQQKVFLPLTEMIQKYGDNVKKVFERYPGIDKDLTQPDGNIYGLRFPQRPFHGTERAGKLFINTTWLKNLGLKMPETTDEFMETLTAFKGNDPNGNGKQDEIPMSGCQTWNGYPEMMLLNSFAYYTPGNPLYYDSGKFDMEVYQPAFKDGVKYVAELVSKDLIDKASWTQNADQLKAQVDIDVPNVGAFNMGHLYIPINFGSERAKDYDIVAPPLKGPEGYSGIPWNDEIHVSGAAAVITDKCKNPEAAFKWLDFCAGDEASLNMMWGMKGKYWDTVQPGDRTILDEPAEFHLIKYRTAGNAEDESYWWQETGFFQTDMNTRFSSVDDIYSAEGGEKRIALTTLAYKPFAVRKSPSFQIPPEIGEQLSLISTNIKSYIDQNLVEFFTGKKNVDKDWDSFLKGLDGLQVKEYIDLTTQAYDQYKQARGEE